MTYTLGDLAKQFGLTHRGDENHIVSGVAPLEAATASDLSFFNDTKYQDQLEKTKAGIVILPEKAASHCHTNLLFSDNPYLTYAKIASLFANPYRFITGQVHASVILGKNCDVHSSVGIGANCVIGDGVSLAEGVHIGPGCVLEEGVILGKKTELKANVTICKNVRIGEACLIHPGAVIGCDGFGNARDGKQWVKVPQLGAVQIGNRVEIGANTTIDCGAISDTIIHDGVRLDNLIQIAHNVEIGENTAIAAGTGIAGSTQIGKNCMIAGQVGINGHITIGDDIIITGMTMVTRSLEVPGVYSSGIPVADSREWRKNAVRFKQLDEIAKRLKQIEKG